MSNIRRLCYTEQTGSRLLARRQLFLSHRIVLLSDVSLVYLDINTDGTHTTSQMLAIAPAVSAADSDLKKVVVWGPEHETLFVMSVCMRNRIGTRGQPNALAKHRYLGRVQQGHCDVERHRQQMTAA